jgi:putative cell wall-binding protein
MQLNQKNNLENHGRIFNMSRTKKVKSIAILLALTFVFTSLFAGIGSIAFAAGEGARIYGGDRYKTAVEISKNGWETSDNVVLVSGQDYPDALAAGPLAQKLDAPILLTTREALPDVTKIEIDRLGAEKVYIVGGTGVIPDSVAKATGKTIERIAGGDRYETAVAVADKLKALGVSTDKVIIARSDDYADALAAAAVKPAMPILFAGRSKDTSLADATKAALTDLGVKSAVIVGDTGAVSINMEEQIDAIVDNVARIGKPDRFKTAVAIAEEFKPADGYKGVVLATGYEFADALAGGPYAAKNGYALLLTGNARTPIDSAVIDFIKANHGITANAVTALGGPKVVLDAALNGAVETAKQKTIAVESAAFATASTITVKFNQAISDTKASFAVKKADTDIGVKSVTFSDDKTSATIQLTAKAAKGEYTIVITGLTDTPLSAKAVMDMPISIENAAATGASKITVNFNQAIPDTSKASFAVKKGSIVVNTQSAAFSDDKAAATIQLASKLTEGEYTVTVTGLTDEALTAKATVSNEKVAKIEIPSKNAVLDRNDNTIVTAAYKVYNQYGEDITNTVGGLVYTASKGTVTPDKDALKIDADSAFAVDDKVTVSIIDPVNNIAVSQTLTVVKAQVSEVKILGLYNTDKKAYAESLSADATINDYKLIVEAKDQYGSAVTDPALVTSDVVVTESNSSVVKAGVFSKLAIDGKDKLVLSLSGPLSAGTSKISIISKFTGKMASFDVVVKEAPKIDIVTLQAPEIAVAGETFEIPFAAKDQYGNAVTKADTLNKGTQITVLPDTVSARFEQDYVKNTAKLVVDATKMTAKGTIRLVVVTGTGKTAQLSINAGDKAVPTVIAGVKDFVATLAETATAQLKIDNITVYDQYGRSIDLPDGYSIKTTSSDTAKVSLSGNLPAIVYAASKGSSAITLELVKDGTVVAGSAYTFMCKVVEKADIASYELADFAKLYEVAPADSLYAVPVKVYGVMADGSKVVIPSTYYSVIVNDVAMVDGQPTEIVRYDYNSGSLVSSKGYQWGNTAERKVPVIVIVESANGPVTLTKDVTVSNEAPVPVVLSLEDGIKTGAVVEGNGVVSVDLAKLEEAFDNKADVPDAEITEQDVYELIVDVVKAIDQYGVELQNEFYRTFMVTNLPEGKMLDDEHPVVLAKGDTFAVTAVTNNSKTISFKVVVK